MLMSALRHSMRKSASTTMTSTQPSSSARFRLASDISMNVAGRKIVVSISTSFSPGRSASMAASTPRVTESVLAPSCFSTISRRPGPSLMTASPIGGGKPSRTSATCAERERRAAPERDRDLPQLGRGADRCLVRDGDPLVRSLDETAGSRQHGVARPRAGRRPASGRGHAVARGRPAPAAAGRAGPRWRRSRRRESPSAAGARSTGRASSAPPG